MKLDAVIAVELGDLVKDEKDYVSLMVKELNIPYDQSLTKNKIFDKYKSVIFQKYNKPNKYPCLVINYNNELNETVTEFLYKNDLLDSLKELKNKVKKIEAVYNKMSPPKKKDDFRF
jgi:hypothetical protein